jgi:hypothetical protein
MKHIIFLVGVTLLLPLFIFSQTAFAKNNSSSTSATSPTTTNYLIACAPGNVAHNTAVCKDVQTQSKVGVNGSQSPVIRLIRDAIDILSFAVGAASIIIIIISGFRFIAANGDSNTLASARSGLLAALVGVFIVILAQSIVIFILDHIK